MIDTHTLHDGRVAQVYERTGNITGIYMTVGERVYCFREMAHYALILSKLKAQDQVATESKGKVEETIKVISARLSRYMNADINYNTWDSRARISVNGSLTIAHV